MLSTKRSSQGYILVSVLILMVLSSLAVVGSLNIASSTVRTGKTTNVRTERYLDAEGSIAQVISWLRINSQKIITPFRKEEFYSRFTITSPGSGDNEGNLFSLPTLKKLSGTNDSVILSTDSGLATAAYPQTEDIVTNTIFAATSNFSTTDLGNAKVRITLLDALPVTEALDFGPPPNPDPETDFYPVFRIDAMTDDDTGAHVYAIVVGKANHLFNYGIYGQDYLEIRQPCDSYDSSDGAYSAASKKANCAAGSNSTSSIHKNEVVYGTVQTNGDIEEEPPFGGDVCADFQAGCPNEGETCSGLDCGVPLLEIYDAWAVYCPSEQADVTYAANTTLSITDSVPADDDVLPQDRCWNKITVNNNVTLTLDATNSPYYIETLELKNSSNSALRIAPSPATGIVEIYVRKIVGDAFNGNQTVNESGRPYQFRIHYLGTDALTLNGTAEMNVGLVAPHAAVTVSGSFDFKGALLAKQLLLTGSGDIHYDESMGGSGPMSDMQFKLREMAQYYR